MSAATATAIEVHLPTLLRDSARGESSVTVAGHTLAEALEELRARHPILHLHLYEEDGRLRKHVVLFFNGQSVARMDALDVALRPGDQIQVVQAVSGG